MLWKLAWRSTIRGLVPKLFVFLLAAGALWTLVTLDRAKSKYDSLNDRGKNFSFAVDEPFIKRLKPTNKNIDVWLEDPSLVKYRKFSSKRALMDTLAEIAVATHLKKVNELTVLEENLREEFKKLSEAGKSVDAPAAEKEGKRALQPERGPDQINADLTEISAKQKRAREELDDCAKTIYSDEFNNKLSFALIDSSKNRFKTSDDLLSPFLDEKTSLFVVFQTFRLTALIIVILTFIFIIVTALSQLPLATGSETASERLKGLISFMPVGGGEVAKAAIIGVAAVGVGTVVVVAANSLESRSSTDRLTAGTNTSKTLVERENTDSVFSNQRLYSQYLLYRFMLMKTTSEVSLADVKPIIHIPAPIVIVRDAPSSIDTAVIVREVQALGTKLKPVQEYAGLNTRLDLIVSAIQNLPKDCNCDTSLTKIGNSLDRLNLLMGGDGLKQNPTPAVSPTPSSTTTATSPTPATPPPILAKLDTLSERLTAIEKELQAISKNNRWARTDTRNIVTRTKKLIVGRTYYLVTEASLDEANAKFKQEKDYIVINQALASMVGRGPTEKAQFLNEFYSAAAVGQTVHDRTLRQRLRALEKQILSLFKMED